MSTPSTLPLRVAVVGGGIGGVAAAVALRRRGLDVRVYEQATALTEVGAGIAIQPNGVRMLRRLGLGDALTRWGARWLRPEFHRPDGTFVAPMWPPDLAATIEFYGLHRADLLQMLVGQLPAGVIHTNHRCVSFTQGDHQAVLSFQNGEEVSADVVVAADGIHSTLQRYVVEPSPPIPSGWVAYRGVIPAASVDWPTGAMRNWVGLGKHFMAYPVRAGQLLNYVGFVPTDERMKESWSAPGDPAELAEAFVGWNETVQGIIAQSDTTFHWGLYDREPLPTWTRGRLTLLGDAAHPMLPHAGQGANQAIEDGVALAAVLSRATPATAPQALQAYEAVRRERTAGVQRLARLNGSRYDGTSRDDRSREEGLATQAQQRAWIWDHDAEAAADAYSLAGAPPLAHTAP